MNPSNYMLFRDIQYEESNRGSDCQYSHGIKCKNYELCKSILPPDNFQLFASYICMNCDMFNWGTLEFRENEECPVCLEHSKQVKFPAKCGHWFCVTCSRNILFWDETRYHLSPVPYGCPPCPNGCVNPTRGKQCYCENYDEILERWEHEYPDNYNVWNEDERNSIGLSETTQGSVFASQKCPLCRKKYE